MIQSGRFISDKSNHLKIKLQKAHKDVVILGLYETILKISERLRI